MTEQVKFLIDSSDWNDLRRTTAFFSSNQQDPLHYPCVAVKFVKSPYGENDDPGLRVEYAFIYCDQARKLLSLISETHKRLIASHEAQLAHHKKQAAYHQEKLDRLNGEEIEQ